MTDIGERVSSLSMKQDRLLCAAALRLNIPPAYDKYMEWGFFDGSVRFYSTDSRKVSVAVTAFLLCFFLSFYIYIYVYFWMKH